jgi:glycosyltransferase involved in cell wall biosynthesis
VKVAIVHDFLNQMGGAEQVVKVFREIFPEAPIYTSVYVPSAVCPSFRTADIRTSFMQRLPMIAKHARRYLPLYPYAFEMFDLSGYDIVLSSSSSFAKGVITPPDTCHISYCYTPMRFAWNYHTYIEQEPFSRLVKFCLPYVIHRVRRWDEITSNRVDYFIAISNEIRRRIWKYYRRDSDIIHPPVDTSKFTLSEKDEGYYLILSRLLPYKRIDIAIEAFNRLGLPLKIVGDGRDLKRLKKNAGPTVEFLGHLSDSEMKRCLSECRALVVPGFEDFGLAPVEAMACGKPVVAYAGGGALETVIDGVTGKLFYEQNPESLAHAILTLDPAAFDPYEIRAHAESFDVSMFKSHILNFITDRYREYRSSPMLSGGPPFSILASVENRMFTRDRERTTEAIDGR